MAIPTGTLGQRRMRRRMWTARVTCLAWLAILCLFLLGAVSARKTRFLDNRDGTVMDRGTGLMWVQHTDVARVPLDWYGCLEYVDRLNRLGYAGYRDWRLPNLNEMASLLDWTRFGPSLPAGHPFTGVADWYWTGTTKAEYASAAWRVYLFLGNIDYVPKRYVKSYLWPVRSPKGPASNVLRTGQVRSFHPSDDGSLQVGRLAVAPRFVDRGDGTISDRLSGLTWVKNADGCAGRRDWYQAVDCIAEMNKLRVAGYSDWRLPRVAELRTLFDYSRSAPALPAGHPFSRVAEDWYWSQDVNVQDNRYAWCANLMTGGVDYYHRGHHRKYVWPVRIANPNRLEFPSPGSKGRKAQGAKRKT